MASRFTSDLGTELWPTWSPDGNEVAFGRPDGIYAQALSGERRTILKTPQYGYPSDWSADGRFLLYRTLSPAGDGDLWAVAAAGTEPPFSVVASPFDEKRGEFSPDGQWVSYECNESGRADVYVRPFRRSGAAIRVSPNGGSEARWNPKGGELFVIAPGARLMSVRVKPTDGLALHVDPARDLFATQIYRGGVQTSNFKFQYAVAPDGERLLVSETFDVSSPLVVALNWRHPSPHLRLTDGRESRHPRRHV